MKRVTTNIDIGKYKFPFQVEGTVESSWEMLTDTCKITVPRKLVFKGKSIAQGDSLFSRGDSISMSMGYDGQLTNYFDGFVSAVHTKFPMEFEGQDAMWKLKQNTITASYQKISLKELLSKHCSIPFEAVDVNLGQFRIKNSSMAKILEELDKSYGLKSWIRNGKLYSGLAYWPKLSVERTFKFGLNIIEDNLEYRKKEDIKVKVTAISMMPDNKKIEIQVGDEEGEQRTLHYYNLPQADLKKRAEAEIENLKYDGFFGSFSTFGEPIVFHGDIAVIKDPFNFGRDGKYLIKKVTYKSGYSGLRQTIELDKRASQ